MASHIVVTVHQLRLSVIIITFIHIMDQVYYSLIVLYKLYSNKFRHVCRNPHRLCAFECEGKKKRTHNLRTYKSKWVYWVGG